jgi:Tol biopolymer transport system component
MQLQWPILSPDGKRIFALGAQKRTELVRYDPKSRQFLPYLGGISADGLSFSNDGKSVTYVRYPQGTLWRGSADGGKRQQLTFPPLGAGVPRWSPDNREIAFMGALPGKSWRIYLVSSDGGAPQQVTHGESGDQGDSDPVWSADGSSLVFGGSPNPGDAPNRLLLRVVDLKTGHIFTLPGSGGVWSPRWSPNGSYIAGLSSDSENLILYDLRTHKQTKLASENINYLTWSNDGRFVYFDRTGSDPAFFRVSIRDRKVERIVGLEDVHRNMGTFGPWTGLAPDGSLLVQRDAGASEIYALDWDAP